MWEFLKIFIFGASTVLTPQPIDVADSWVELELSEPLEAISPGASIEIRLDGLKSAADPLSRMAVAKLRHPNHCIRARLVTKQGSMVDLTELAAGVSKDSTFLLVSRDGGIPTNRKFTRLMLSATCELKEVTVTWHNYRK